MKKLKLSSMMLVAVMLLASSVVVAGEVTPDFDGSSVRAVNFINAIKDKEAGESGIIKGIQLKSTPVPPPTPSLNPLFSYLSIGEMGRIAQSQPAIKEFVASYNQHVLHDTKVGTDLQLEGVVIALKLPSQVIVTKNGEVLDTIDNVIMLNTIRYNIGGSDVAITRGCTEFIIQTIAVWVIDHFIDKVVKTCSAWVEENSHPVAPIAPIPPTHDMHPEQPHHHQAHE